MNPALRLLDGLQRPAWLSLAALTPVRSGLARWIEGRSPRERWLFAGLAAVVVVAAYVTLVWQPIAAARVKAIGDIARYDALAVRLRNAGPDVARIAANRASAPSTIVTESASRAGLTIQRIEPQGANIDVTLEGAGFDNLILWLAALEHDAGLRAVSVKLERRPDPGIVDAQITLAG